MLSVFLTMGGSFYFVDHWNC